MSLEIMFVIFIIVFRCPEESPPSVASLGRDLSQRSILVWLLHEVPGPIVPSHL